MGFIIGGQKREALVKSSQPSPTGIEVVPSTSPVRTYGGKKVTSSLF